MKALLIIAILFFIALGGYSQVITSPQKKLTLSFQLTEKGEPTYQLSIGNKKVTEPSLMGLELKDQPALAEDFTLTRIDTTVVNDNGIRYGARLRRLLTTIANWRHTFNKQQRAG